MLGQALDEVCGLSTGAIAILCVKYPSLLSKHGSLRGLQQPVPPQKHQQTEQKLRVNCQNSGILLKDYSNEVNAEFRKGDKYGRRALLWHLNLPCPTLLLGVMPVLKIAACTSPPPASQPYAYLVPGVEWNLFPSNCVCLFCLPGGSLKD